MTAHRGPTPPAADRSRTHRRRLLVAVAAVSSVTAAAATVVSLAALGYLSPRVVERDSSPTSASPVLASTTVKSARSAASKVSPAVVEIVAVYGDTRRRGSGVVLRGDGLIATSARLVEGATTVMVNWPTGRSADAEVRGTDPLSGLAALVVPGPEVTAEDVTRSTAEPGGVVITVGASSEDQGPSLVQGHVSATGAHADPDGGRLLGLIETDQPVPDWADGAALVDGDGALIGLSLSVPQKQATGWAVPIATVNQVADDLHRLGRVDRGWLGIRGTAADAEGRRPAGVMIDDMEAGSPAWDAGLRNDDLIVAVGGTAVRSLADVQAALTLTRPGEEIVIERVRDDTSDKTTVTLGSSPR
jgi:S1-C subfamily serine protease